MRWASISSRLGIPYVPMFRSELNSKFKHSLPENCLLNKKLKVNDKEIMDLNKIDTDLSAKYGITYLIPPVKSLSDKKEYLVIRLRNGLTALLISDVENLISDTELIQSSGHGYDGDGSEHASICSEHSVTGGSTDGHSVCSDDSADHSEKWDNSEDNSQDEKLAACALTVGVGSFSDPEEIPGLAHFLEHMLFMGSEKFPKENEFDSFITNRGGSDNASTECEYTTFYFDIPDRNLGGALSRFASFFTQPLMMRDSMTREREAVESEFKLHLSSDTCRAEQIFCSTAPLNNPVHKFMWGNLITLQQNVTDDNLYKALRNLWERHYSAHRMTLALQARLPLTVMGIWVAEYFDQISCNNMPPDIFNNVDPPFKMDIFNKMYTVLSVKDKHRLQITWVFPSILYLYKSKPMSYLTFLIGHEGEGSLISHLREKLWALHLIAGNSEDGIESNAIYSLFSVDIDLTEDGLKNIENIIKLVFSYIKLLQNSSPVESIFEEIRLVDEMSFNFTQETASSDYVESLSQNMQIYPSEDYITGDKLIFEYKPDEITKLLNAMTINNCNIMILSKTAAGAVNLDHCEPWFNTKYNLADIPENLKEEIQNCEPNPNFFLPTPNKYIASDFEILPEPSTGIYEYPKRIVNNKIIEVWYKQDIKFKLPFGYIKTYLISPIATSMPIYSVMCDILVSIFNVIVIKETFPATAAGLDYSLSCSDNGLTLTVEGFHHKIHLLLQTLLKELISLKKKINNPGLFKAIKEEQIKKYTNKTLKPSILGNELRLSILCKPYWTSVEKLEAIQYVTLNKLIEFSNNIFEELFIKCLIQGNISKEQALDISNSIINTINCRPILSGCYPITRVRKLPIGEKILRVQSFNRVDTNSYVKNYYQCHTINTESSCIIEMLMLLMQEPFFDTLRTQEQLGYDVDCGIKDTFGILGFTMAVKSQAEKFTVSHVENRITEFIKKISNDLNALDFDNVKDSLKILKQQADTRLKEEVQRNWAEISSNEYEFDRVKKEIKCIDALKKQDVYKFFKKIMEQPKDNSSNQNLCLRKLSIQVDGDNSATENKINTDQLGVLSSSREIKSILYKRSGEEKKTKYIRDIKEFQNSLYIYPVKARSFLPK